MKKLLLTLSIGLLAANSLQSQSITRLTTVCAWDDQIRVFDTSSYAVVKTITLSTNSFSLTGATGLVKQPSTGTYYMIANAGSTRYLATLNPHTGSVTAIASLGDKFAGITFNSNGSLFGVTGNGATLPNTVFRINPATAATSSITTFVNGSYGESICFNPVSNKVYNWTGSPTIYEKFDTTFVSSSSITTTFPSEVAGSVYKSPNKFIITTYFGSFSEIDTLGNTTSLISYSTNIKGLAYITCPRSITGISTVCGSSPATLTMSANGTSYQWFHNGVAVANATTQAISTPSLGHYNCIISDGCGTDSLGAGINVISGTVPVVTISGNTLICSGQTTTLTGSAGGTSQWYKNGVVIPSATSNTYAATTSGIYNMTKTNTNGCKDSASVGKTVSVTPTPTVNATGGSSLICSGQQLTLTATGATSYSWSTGQSTSSVVISPTTTTSYSVTGTTGNCLNTYTLSQAVSACTGLSAVNVHGELSVYPNPTSGKLMLNSASELIKCEIYSVAGKLLKEVPAKESNLSIDMSDLSNGIYFLFLTSQNGAVNQYKIVLSK